MNLERSWNKAGWPLAFAIQEVDVMISHAARLQRHLRGGITFGGGVADDYSTICQGLGRECLGLLPYPGTFCPIWRVPWMNLTREICFCCWSYFFKVKATIWLINDQWWLLRLFVPLTSLTEAKWCQVFPALLSEVTLHLCAVPIPMRGQLRPHYRGAAGDISTGSQCHGFPSSACWKLPIVICGMFEQ